MKIGIITPMPEEKGSLVAALDNKQTVLIADMEIIVGDYGHHQVILMESGIGKVAAATATTVLIQQYQPDAIINTGSAGALDPQLQIGDTVIGRQLAYSDVDVTVFGYDYGQLPGQPTYFEADSTLVETFSKLTTGLTGLIVSGDQFVQQEQKTEIKKHFPQALVAEMEGAAVAQVAQRFNIPFIILRGVSDLANGDSGIDFDEYVVEAGRASAQLLLTFLDQQK
ncbi:5'-methylthioadenosine/adenosylhomocysteine nucleosidase [Convivina intestini]|uniref:adenosylhomocysteine nucleosidase n=1 Tax=Convivina intestini TaxID=1505726 RepID=A0A2U1DC06_9LACO|nr:5'-methylthioadenosine/adenosylhomocysteine nucleosidase [Convivina intestini]PVY85201.1 adenosylhomocysteine nucleosidase [Convivina intestini]CAH1852401.1 5'-methylthioadenosine/S-adenosylhomocysteine nucleosidase [Convivina intestini]CAH1854579.1 5'-methylthioadenosine/S-adenosylhomocysteine nucleosidase [Convivina intestini]SDC00501.1 adenosylhomocysteine nucleosidase [Leuconostocaceae bacterium R-53105]